MSDQEEDDDPGVRLNLDDITDLDVTDPSDNVLGVGIVRPPRNTSKASLPQSCELKRSALGRTQLFMPNVHYTDLRCSSSITQHVQRHSLFHAHGTNGRRPDEYSRPSKFACWHCCHSFSPNPPIPAPKDYEAAEGLYVVYGVFCSFPCAKSFLQSEHTFNSGYQMMLLHKLAREVYGIKGSIVAAPPRLSLDVFGGPFPIERFRSMTNECAIHSPPFVSTYMVVEEREQAHDVTAMGVDGGGSVRGLRRPSAPLHTERSLATSDCLYNDFLRGKDDVPQPHKLQQRSEKAQSASRRTSSTLTAFMKQT